MDGQLGGEPASATDSTATPRIRAVLACAAVLVGAAPLRACPLCDSEAGERVRAGIFNADFASNVFATLLPFPVFLGLVAAIYFGLPRSRAVPGKSGPPGAGVTHDP